MIKDRTNITA